MMIMIMMMVLLILEETSSSGMPCFDNSTIYSNFWYLVKCIERKFNINLNIIWTSNILEAIFKMLTTGQMKISYVIWILKITRTFRYQYGVFLRQYTFWRADKSKVEFWLNSIFLKSRPIESSIYSLSVWPSIHPSDRLSVHPSFTLLFFLVFSNFWHDGGIFKNCRRKIWAKRAQNDSKLSFFWYFEKNFH